MAEQSQVQVKEGLHGALVEIGRFLFVWRNWVFTVGLILLLFGFRPVVLHDNWTHDLWLDLAGLALTLAGQAIRILVIGYTQIDSGGTKKQIAAHALQTSGLLNHVRNPLYIGNILVIVGLTLIHNDPWVYALGIPIVIFAYVAIVAAEEVYLTERFGDAYREYCRRVRRWLPDPRGLTRSLREARFDGRRVLLQEYGSIWIAVGLPLAIVLYEHLVGPPSPAQPLWVRGVGLAFLVTTAIWAWLRRIKRIEVARRRAERLAAEGQAEGTAAA